MIKIERVQVMNFENAIRGARNPLNSWDRMDSYTDEKGNFVFGKNDMALAQKLCRGGQPHRKFARQIFVTMDITAPLYWWKEFDTYKVGTVANSTSTMHKIHSKPIECSDFSCEKLSDESKQTFESFVAYIEKVRGKYVADKNKADWYEIIQMLPSSYNQTRTCTMNYETLIIMHEWRHNHKLEEWREFCVEVEKLPYFVEMFELDKAKQAEDVVSNQPAM